MGNKEDLQKMAQTFREAADILDEMADFTDSNEEMTREERGDREDELLARFAVKMMKIQKFGN